MVIKGTGKGKDERRRRKEGGRRSGRRSGRRTERVHSLLLPPFPSFSFSSPPLSLLLMFDYLPFL